MSEIDDAAALLAEARRSGVPMQSLPEELVPTTVGEAYAIQDAVLKLLKVPVAGWKVAPMVDDNPPFCAPLLADIVFASPAKLSADAFPKAEVEVEIALRLDKDLPPRPSPYRREDVIDAIGTAHPAFEILGSRFTDRLAPPRLVAIADMQSNSATVYGPAAPSLAALDFSTVGITLKIDGDVAAMAEKGATTIQVLDAVAWLADHAASRGWPLKAGQILITGARIGPMPIAGSARLDAELQGVGTVSAVYG